MDLASGVVNEQLGQAAKGKYPEVSTLYEEGTLNFSYPSQRFLLNTFIPKGMRQKSWS